MNKVYKKIVVYCPTSNTISHLVLVPYSIAVDEKDSDELFYAVWQGVDRRREIVIGITIGGNFYQLSPTQYGTYIKESWNAMKLIDKSRLLCCIAQYQIDNKIPFD